jgi:hypothetical protein
MELVKINPTDYNLTDDTAKNIQQQFEPMLKKMVELEEEFNQIINLPVGENETTKKAKELRLKYVKVRTGTADIHKNQKAFYLNGGRFIDGWKNAQLFASQGKELKLEEIEKYHENIEKQRVALLDQERTSLISPYLISTSIQGFNLGIMADEVWDAFFDSKKKLYEQQQEIDRLTELNKEEESQAKELELQAQIKENERLRNELKQNADALMAEKLEQLKVAEYLAKQTNEEQLEHWINSFEIADAPFVNDVTKDIIDKFKGFKNWAYKLK